MTTDDALAWLREEGDLVGVIGAEVDLIQSGKEYKALCPFHEEKTPSFYVVPEKGFYKCFGCGESGDLFSFVEKTQGVGFLDALRWLAEHHGIELEQRRSRSPDAIRRMSRQESYVEDAAELWLRVGIKDPVRRHHLGADLTGTPPLLLIPFWGPADPRSAPGGWLGYRSDRRIVGWHPRGRSDLGGCLLLPSDFRRRIADEIPVFTPSPLTALRMEESGILALSAAPAPREGADPWLEKAQISQLIQKSGEQLGRIGLAVPIRDQAGRRHNDYHRAFHETARILFGLGIEPILVDVGKEGYGQPFGWNWAQQRAAGPLRPEGENVLVCSAFQVRVHDLSRRLADQTIDVERAVEGLIEPLRALRDRNALLYETHLAWATQTIPDVTAAHLESRLDPGEGETEAF